MKMDIILSKWCLAILFAFGILACTDGGDANELPKEPEGTGENQDEKILLDKEYPPLDYLFLHHS